MVAQRNTTFKLPDVEKLARTQFVEITAEHWTAICRNVVKVEDKYIINERLLDDALEDFEFMVNAGSSDEDFSPDEDVDDRSPVRHVVDVEISVISIILGWHRYFTTVTIQINLFIRFNVTFDFAIK